MRAFSLSLGIVVLISFIAPGRCRLDLNSMNGIEPGFSTDGFEVDPDAPALAPSVNGTEIEPIVILRALLLELSQYEIPENFAADTPGGPMLDLEGVPPIVQNASALSYAVAKASCDCSNNVCKCCSTLKVSIVGAKACANLHLNPSQKSIGIQCTLNDLVFYSSKITMQNPPDICYSPKSLGGIAKLCISLKDLELRKSSFRGCVHFKIGDVLGIFKPSMNLGCISVPLRGPEAGQEAETGTIDPLQLPHLDPTPPSTA